MNMPISGSGASPSAGSGASFPSPVTSTIVSTLPEMSSPSILGSNLKDSVGVLFDRIVGSISVQNAGTGSQITRPLVNGVMSATHKSTITQAPRAPAG